MSGASISVTLGREIVASYRPVDDMEREFAGPGDIPSGDPAETGWMFELRAREFMSISGKPKGDEPWVTLIEGGSVGGVDVAAAVLISVIIENIGLDVPREVEHLIHGSGTTFKKEFAGAFDLAIGAPELLPPEEEWGS